MKKNVINTPIKDFTSVNTEERKKIKISSGDTVKVWNKIKEKIKGKERTRLQAFEGLVVSTKHGTENGATFTVRKVSYGVGIERIFPLFSPMIDKIEVIKKGKVRKSKLYYIRDKVTKQIKRLTRRASLVNISTTSDIEETEKKIKEAELEAKKTEEEAAAKKAEEEVKISEEVKEHSEQSEDNSEKAEADDLTKIEGIGPKIAEVLNKNGITTFAQLAAAKDEDTQEMIKEVKGNHQAGTWNEQAALARDGKWEELKELQDKLDGGVEK